MKRLTLVSGRNNVGKSSLLEALFLYMDHTSTDSFAKLNGFRSVVGAGVSGLWEPLFFNRQTDKTLRIQVADDGVTGELSYRRDGDYLPEKLPGLSDGVIAQFRMVTRAAYSLAFSFREGDYEETGHFSLNGTSVIRDIQTSLSGNEIKQQRQTQYESDRFYRVPETLTGSVGSIELSGRKNELLDVLRLMEPELEDVFTIVANGVAQLYARISGEMIPLQYAGDGFLKLLAVSLAMMERQGGLVLVDELETGLHYSILEKFWRVIDRISERTDCQVIATTHSYELIKAACSGIEHTKDFAYYRLGVKQDGILAHRFDFSMLEKAVDSELEIR